MLKRSWLLIKNDGLYFQLFSTSGPVQGHFSRVCSSNVLLLVLAVIDGASTCLSSASYSGLFAETVRFLLQSCSWSWTFRAIGAFCFFHQLMIAKQLVALIKAHVFSESSCEFLATLKSRPIGVLVKLLVFLSLLLLWWILCQCYTHTHIYCIWQPGCWINTKHNKNVNNIIIQRNYNW